jgi:hypothetical protein
MAANRVEPKDPAMKAVRIHRFGGPEVLDLEDVPEPHASDDMLLIDVRAASVNPAAHPRGKVVLNLAA